ncbi:MAG: hypothetical protein QNJ12_08350 [Ilumatobacter sp.]|uniref:hypothetical protein n=1 Tax=Ilumatobacter sp. TaxID=1967498 RepID=UPI0026135FA5|nr:hypothetical protein [Ilumatobacter sp.]MDJ0768790.1 hypothetical protein [Ilumatobacter sp.]
MDERPIRSDVERRLERMGEVVPAAPSEHRIAAIEQRVMAAITTRAPNRRRVLTAAVALAAATLFVIAAFVAFAALDRGGDATFALADGVTLESPGGPSVAIAAGDDVPDGSIIVVAAGGEAVVDGDRYGPGRYRVTDGMLVPLVRTPSARTTTSPTGPPTGTTTPEASIREGDLAPVDRPTTAPATPVEVSRPTPDERTATTGGASIARDPTTTGPTTRDRPTTTSTTVADRPTTVADRPTTTDARVTSTRVTRTIDSSTSATPTIDASTSTVPSDRRPDRP